MSVPFYPIMTGGATFVTAWVADNYIKEPQNTPKWFRFMEAIIVAMAFLLIQWLVQDLVVSQLNNSVDMVNESDKLIRRMVAAASVGGILGYSIPHMCRYRYLLIRKGILERFGGFQPV